MTLPATSPRNEQSSMRQNNFDLVRLTLATIVVLFHAGDLSLSKPIMVVSRLASARVAVEGFFAISGFLIFASYERCASLREYFANRAWRILPGYWLSTIFCLAIAFSVGSFHVGKFLMANLTFSNFLHPGIDGVFEFNPATAMNGALWTIKVEIMFYISVPIIVWLCRRTHRDVVLWSLFVLSALFQTIFAKQKISAALPGQLSYFMIGALIYYHLPEFKKHGKWIMLAAAALYGLHLWTGWYFPRPAAIAALTLGVSLLVPHIKGPTRWGDFSYGTYILHWPIIQILVAAGLFEWNPWLALLCSLALVAAAAAFSWFFVEKRSLAHAKSRRLRRSALGATANYPPAVP